MFSRTCCPTLVVKSLMRDLLTFVPDACSPVTLHSVAAALKHLRFALRCWSLLTFIRSDTSTPELSGLPSHLACWNLHVTSPQFRPPTCFQGKAFFRQALAKLSPNSREKSPYSFFAK